jgi:hypothetical protein
MVVRMMIFWVLAPCRLIALKMETVCFSKMLASTKSVWFQNPDHHHKLIFTSKFRQKGVQNLYNGPLGETTPENLPILKIGTGVPKKICNGAY